MQIKALSVRQPWASLIAEGTKTIELRTWRTSYRGPLLICASKYKKSRGPKGVAVAIVDLVDVRLATSDDTVAACCTPLLQHYAWILSNSQITPPIPITGRLSIFDVKFSLVDLHLA